MGQEASRQASLSWGMAHPSSRCLTGLSWDSDGLTSQRGTQDLMTQEETKGFLEEVLAAPGAAWSVCR